MDINSVNDILDFAMDKEQAAADFYNDLAGKMNRPQMKEIFLNFAKEEMAHKAKLKGVKDGKQLIPVEKKVLDLKIAEHLVDAKPSSDMNYQEALILAMKAEKEAFKLYSMLADAIDDPNVKTIFSGLAQEEAKHKLRFELEYDDMVYQEN